MRLRIICAVARSRLRRADRRRTAYARLECLSERNNSPAGSDRGGGRFLKGGGVLEGGVSPPPVRTAAPASRPGPWFPWGRRRTRARSLSKLRRKKGPVLHF